MAERLGSGLQIRLQRFNSASHLQFSESSFPKAARVRQQNPIMSKSTTGHGVRTGRALVIGRGASGRAAASALASGGLSVDFAEGFDIVVASPGMRVVSELQYGVGLLRERGVRMLAVTGSKGKSSVVKVVADALRLAGLRAEACGNYGLPVSEVAQEDPPPDWAVVEVSSFMMETTNLAPGTFEAAALLNLQEDHLDRHGSVEVYHALKRRLLPMAKLAIDATDPASLDLSAAGLLAGSYFDNDVLRANGLAAVALMRAAGLDGGTVRAAFAAFEPLPHRMNEIGVFGGVRFIDDSKATSIAALAAGVEMAGEGPVRLIAGGLPKGDDPKTASSLLTKRVKKVYLIGQCAESFGQAWSDAVDCEVCGTMERAVEAAMRDAEKGDTVLLSPGAASFDQFQSFGERGEVFARLVKKEGKNE